MGDAVDAWLVSTIFGHVPPFKLWWQTTVCVILQTGKGINMDYLARKPHAERAKLGLLACYVKIAVINLRISGKYRASALLARVTNPNRA